MNLKINTSIDMSGVKSYNLGTSSVRNNSVNRGNTTTNNLNNYKEIDYSDAALAATPVYANNATCKATSINKNTTTRSAKITIMEQTLGGEGNGTNGTHTIAGEFQSATKKTNNTSIRVNTLKSGNKINNCK